MKKLFAFLILFIFLSFKDSCPMSTFSEKPWEIAQEFGPLIIDLYKKIYCFFYHPNLMLIDAAKENDISLFKKALRFGADINFSNEGGNNALHFAALNNSLTVLKQLLNNGAIPNSVNNIGNTPLHVASYDNNRNLCLKFLIEYYKENDIDINCVNKNNSTPLHLAVITGSCENTAILIEARSDINIQDNDGYTALHIAIIYAQKFRLEKLKRNNFLEIIKQLIISGADEKIVDNKRKKAGYYIKGNSLILKIIREAREEKSKIRNSAKHALDSRIKQEMDQALKAQRHLQKLIGESEVIILQKYLRKYLACKNSQLIREPEENKTYDRQQKLRTFNKPNNNPEKMARRKRAKKRRKEERESREKALEEAKTQAKKLRKKQKACLNKFIEILKENEVEVLPSSFEALFKFKDEDENTILHIFTMCEEMEWLRFIINTKKIDLNIRNSYGETPLHCSIYLNNSDICELLLDSGADPNIQDVKGNTSLHLAIFKKNEAIIDKLLNYDDIDINLKNTTGYSVLDYAQFL